LHYALVPHAGGWQQAAAYRSGLEFNNPLILHKAAPHSGPLPPRWGLFEFSATNVVLSALRPASDGSTLVRVYEAAGSPAERVRMTWHAKILEAHEANLMEDSGNRVKTARDSLEFNLHPFEIKTFKLRLAKR
jgi:alpha-mannosidase